ncbi:UNVERIFIED_CONTAM: hypothetical protein HDU68_011520 [Siphonaria sp. JEL0065]|nr:hypothetical protein HDU68_011520 [Siphonaria sp. JEL0065]
MTKLFENPYAPVDDNKESPFLVDDPVIDEEVPKRRVATRSFSIKHVICIASLAAFVAAAIATGIMIAVAKNSAISEDGSYHIFSLAAVNPAATSPQGQRCTFLGDVTCVNGITYQCAYYDGASLTFGQWYVGGCAATTTSTRTSSLTTTKDLRIHLHGFYKISQLFHHKSRSN